MRRSRKRVYVRPTMRSTNGACRIGVMTNLLRRLAETSVFVMLMLALAWPITAVAEGGVAERLRNFFSSPPPPPPRLVLVFVDISGSIPEVDWDIYQKTYSSLVGSREGREEQAAIRKGQQDQPGDKLILGVISEGTLVNFVAVAEGELKDTGQLRRDRDQNESVLKNLYSGMAKIRTMKSARRTKIFDALTLSQQLIERDKERKPVIVLLSDMLEDSEIANFEKRAPTSADTEAIIKRQKSRGLLPNLNSAQIFVAGAKAPNSSHYEAVRAFWVRYLNEAKAVIEPGMYGRAAIDFGTAWRERR